jgi:YidC/Oxa1 family membrane protein insertase
MDRRASLAFFLFMIVVSAWLMWKQLHRPPPAPPAEITTPASGETPAKPPEPAAAPAPVPSPPPAPTAFEATHDVPLDDAIHVETDLYDARLTNRGGALRELRLKKYFRTAGIAGDPAREADPNNWLPLSTDLDPDWPQLLLRRNPDTGGGGVAIEHVNWESERREVDGGTEVHFRVHDGDGLVIEKILRFRPGRYDIGVELRFSSEREGTADSTRSYLLTAVSNITEVHRTRFSERPGFVVTGSNPDELTVRYAAKLADATGMPFLRNELAPFVGATNNYFAFALRPDAATRPLVEAVSGMKVFDRDNYALAEREKEAEQKRPLSPDEQKSLHDEWDTNIRAEAMLRVPLPAKGAAPRTFRFDLFAGMRSPEIMARDDYADFRILYEVQYGGTWFRWINRLLLAWMRVLHLLTRNWGISIILLTVTVKGLLFPLNRLQSRTMETFQKKMKQLQPEIDALKQRYKNNMQKMNSEQQKLMAAHGVRPPIFGCLILFLQMPVWYGLYQSMRTAPELRQAPFFGWITDLSAPDNIPLPFHLPLLGAELHLLPIVMVVAWLVQNRMMPKATEPQQAQMQKMMNFFPILFGFMLYSYASGLSLYMLVNSILGMLQMKFLRVTPSA